MKNRVYGKSFTMAEILISLTIIGVIAAITLPALRANINEAAWNTQRKALYSRMSQAISLMPSLNGYGIGATDEETAEHATEAFITDGLSKVLKINNICNYDNFKNCGLTSKIKTSTGNKINIPTLLSNLLGTTNTSLTSLNIPNTRFAAFETQNGESIAVYYNPFCMTDNFDYNDMHSYDGNNTLKYLCVNFVIDLNGKKGPNTVGMDIQTISAFYPTDSYIVNPVPNKKFLGNASYYDAIKLCKDLGDNYRLPTIQEWMGMYTNQSLCDYKSDIGDHIPRYWSITSFNSTAAWTMFHSIGVRRVFKKEYEYRVRCIKR